MKNKPFFFDSLDQLEQEVIRKLSRGYQDKKSPFRYLVFSTSKNNYVNSRIMVLRSFSSKDWELTVHTDKRSSKLDEIETNNRVSINFWDSRKNFQVRLFGKAFKFDFENEKIWNNLSAWSKRTYLTNSKPGTVSKNHTSGFDEKFFNLPPSHEESKQGKENFCQIKIKIEKLDILVLNRMGYRRALFEVKNKEIKKKWLIP
tara:strand:+ start:776 stop:1381 length:606 start_codon:yes stop_codon:yes gene_type:complete